MKDVFISYAREDANRASRIKTELEQAGYTCWLDTSEILGGDEWVCVVHCYRHREADACVSLISNAAQHSDWMLKEFLFAKERGKPIIPVLIEDCPLPLHLHLVDRQGVPLYREYQGGLNKLLRVLERTPGSADRLAVQDRRREFAPSCRSPASQS